jgi:riboflavin kinase/FMN adenylyltransferase
MNADVSLARILADASPSRFPTVAGVVSMGDQRGRTLGFPTANLVLSPDGDLADGVYAGWYIRPSGERFPAAVSVGRRVTFYERGARLLEAHLLDFAEDLYGELAIVELVAFLRPQQRFHSLEDLRAQLGEDVELARAVLVASEDASAS